MGMSSGNAQQPMHGRGREMGDRTEAQSLTNCSVVVTNPDDPKFDLEAYLTKVADETK